MQQLPYMRSNPSELWAWWTTISQTLFISRMTCSIIELSSSKNSYDVLPGIGVTLENLASIRVFYHKRKEDLQHNFNKRIIYVIKIPYNFLGNIILLVIGCDGQTSRQPILCGFNRLKWWWQKVFLSTELLNYTKKYVHFVWFGRGYVKLLKLQFAPVDFFSFRYEFKIYLTLSISSTSMNCLGKIFLSVPVLTWKLS